MKGERVKRILFVLSPQGFTESVQSYTQVDSLVKISVERKYRCASILKLFVGFLKNYIFSSPTGIKSMKDFTRADLKESVIRL